MFGNVVIINSDNFEETSAEANYGPLDVTIAINSFDLLMFTVKCTQFQLALTVKKKSVSVK